MISLETLVSLMGCCVEYIGRGFVERLLTKLVVLLVHEWVGIGVHRLLAVLSGLELLLWVLHVEVLGVEHLRVVELGLRCELLLLVGTRGELGLLVLLLAWDELLRDLWEVHGLLILRDEFLRGHLRDLL